MGMCLNVQGRVWHCAEHPAPWVHGCCSTLVFLWLFLAILGGCALDTALPKHIILFTDVTLLNSAVTSYVMSQQCMCIGHMTFYYERSGNTMVGVLSCCSSVCQVRLTRDLSSFWHISAVSISLA